MEDNKDRESCIRLIQVILVRLGWNGNPHVDEGEEDSKIRLTQESNIVYPDRVKSLGGFMALFDCYYAYISMCRKKEPDDKGTIVLRLEKGEWGDVKEYLIQLNDQLKENGL